MGNKTVIMTTLNDAWTEPGSVLDLFLESFGIGNGTSQLLNHLVFITMGQKAHERCMSMRGHCFDLNTKGANLSEQKDYNTPGYLDIMWQRLDFQRQVLEKGYGFIFTDTDILWFRNPLPHFYPQGDFQVSCDRFFGNATDLENWPSNGFNYVRSNNRTISFFKYWYSARTKYPQDHDQAVFNYIKHDAYLRELGLTIRFLDSKYFHGLCEIRNRDWDAVCTVHANCRIGLSSKLSELRGMLEEWKTYISGNHS
ncbi:hypothetical protein C4D60_Mb04t33140 [Musa balbisiana]|uniref:Nucleotide-diphospho-sugar transferase domain-containing protein n=1 Tax=Musa balbisiana TaxID=52838 RepID=A0A4S8KGL6_MUSBA|nr:hypothetical protein C4D60_Mb04t33140 [Musa balbisiana]